MEDNKEIVPGLSDEEVNEMNQDDYERKFVTMNEEEEEEDSKDFIAFSIDDLDILSAKENDVLLRGHYFFGDNKDEDCILIMSRELFHDTLNRYLNGKEEEDDFESLGEFCEGGVVCCTEFTKEGKINLLIHDEGYYGRYKKKEYVPTYINAQVFRVTKTEVDIYS